MAEGKAKFECRMYEKMYPDVDECVMVLVKSVGDMGAYVYLLEYNNIVGMIPLSELTRRRFRSRNKLIRVGKTEVGMVLRVDTEKGYIDLSKHRVTPEDYAATEEKYHKSKQVHSIMRHVAQVLDLNLEEMYKQFGWELYRRYGHALNAFTLALQDEDAVFADLDVSAEVRAALLQNIRRRLAPSATKIRADVELTCFTVEGIDAIKRALAAGIAVGEADTTGAVKKGSGPGIAVKLVAPPLYVMTCNAAHRGKGIDLLTKALEVVKEDITGAGGTFVVKEQPHAVDSAEDEKLAKILEDLERKNMEVSGDDDTSDNES